MTAQRCPVCNGRGGVMQGFYSGDGETFTSSSTALEHCRSCDGTGVVWGGGSSCASPLPYWTTRYLIGRHQVWTIPEEATQNPKMAYTKFRDTTWIDP